MFGKNRIYKWKATLSLEEILLRDCKILEKKKENVEEENTLL